ncbi:ATP-binding protein [Mesorhizobium amorphae]|uniref:ATP-binding protein n=1 Tax=Mesorhizobium amorphae TaxID=71433 RepID=UPI00177BD385|nr:ATP-binding protein [Mesorhizobium amorphae]
MMAGQNSAAAQLEIEKVIERFRGRPGHEDTVAALEAMLVPTALESAPERRWTLPFLAAATRASFTLKDLRDTAAGSLPEPSSEELSLVLDESLAVAGLPRGEPARYILTDTARHAVLRDRRGEEDLAGVLAAASITSDRVTHFLTILLIRWNGDGGLPWASADLKAMSGPDMEAAVQAASLVVELWPELKPLREEMRRRLDLEEVIEPLRVLIGRVGPIGTGQGPDSFIGREEALLRLYEHVGVTPPRSLLDRARRTVRRLVEAVTGAPKGALVVHGMGGMGKSALISKFVLDHVGNDQLLFAYLDFDRSTLTRGGTSALLVEVARQIGLQLDGRKAGEEAARAQLADLRASLRGDLYEGAQLTSASHADMLKAIVNSLPGQPRLLLVFDTVERVQALDPDAIKSSQELLRRLGLFDGSWDRLRVVGCSRTDVPELRAFQDTPKPIDLPKLTDAQARELAAAILREQHPGRRFPPALIAAMADAADGYPLFVRSLAGYVSAAGLDSDADFIRDLKSTHGRASRVATVFYARFADRILLPGGAPTFKAALCLRIVTLPLLEAVLRGLGTELTAQEIQAAIAKLDKDVTLWAERGPGGLRWRPDLRALLLGCIREDDPETGSWLRRVAMIALETFRPLPEDDETAAALLYYTLLSGRGIEAADRFWRPGRAFRRGLVDASADFLPESVEACYVRLVAARRRPSAEDLDLLPDWIGWRLSWDASPTLATPASTGIKPETLKLLDIARSLQSGEPDFEPRLFALLAKTGRWQEAQARLSRPIMDGSVDRVDLLNWMVRAGPVGDRKVGDEMLELGRALAGEAATGPRRRGSPRRKDGEGLVGALVAARIWEDDELFESVDPIIADLHALRLQSENLAASAIVIGSFGDRSSDWAIEVVYQAKLLQAVSTRQLLLLRETCRLALPRAADELEKVWPADNSSPSDSEMPARAWTESAVIRTVVTSLWDLRHGWSDQEARWAFFRSFLALRNPDWIEPLGYAIADGHAQALRASIAQLVEEKRLQVDASLLSPRRSLRDPTDALRILDEAGALGPCLAILKKTVAQEQGFASRILESIRSSTSSASAESRGELLWLISRFENWQAAKQGIMVPPARFQA